MALTAVALVAGGLARLASAQTSAPSAYPGPVHVMPGYQYPTMPTYPYPAMPYSYPPMPPYAMPAQNPAQPGQQNPTTHMYVPFVIYPMTPQGPAAVKAAEQPKDQAPAAHQAVPAATVGATPLGSQPIQPVTAPAPPATPAATTPVPRSVLRPSWLRQRSDAPKPAPPASTTSKPAPPASDAPKTAPLAGASAAKSATDKSAPPSPLLNARKGFRMMLRPEKKEEPIKQVKSEEPTKPEQAKEPGKEPAKEPKDAKAAVHKTEVPDLSELLTAACMEKVSKETKSGKAEKSSKLVEVLPDALPPTIDCDGPACPREHRVGIVVFTGLDSWNGIADHLIVTQDPDGTTGDGAQGNFGLHIGANAAIGLFERLGVGFQSGFSYGSYDFDGRFFSADFDEQERSGWQQQLFFTTGFFKRRDVGIPVVAALVWDYQINDNFGALTGEPSLGQWRALLGVPLGQCDEVGFWGTLRDGRSSQFFFETETATNAPVTYSAVNQYNAYWQHDFQSGVRTLIYAGVTDHSRHGIGPGSLGSWLIGGNLLVPLNCHWALYANAMYMKPSATASPGIDGGLQASIEDAYNLTVGIAWFPCSNLRSCKRGWLPVLPVANNGSFLVDISSLQLPPDPNP